MIKDFFHFSTTLEWLETKSEFSKWSLYKEKGNQFHLYKSVPRLISLHWFSYLEKDKLKGRINNIINNKDKFFINLIVIKLINKNLDPLIKEDYQFFYKYGNKNTFIRRTNSSLKSNLENFIIVLKNYDEVNLTKNWKRNLKRSEKKASEFQYKFLNAYDEINEIYSVIIKNALLKKFKYPYSKRFLKGIFEKSKSNIVAIGAYNNSDKLVAVRAYYKVNNTAIDFIAAALPEALKYYVTYNLAYQLIQDAKKKGNELYNLGGVNYIMNKGVYNFKKGLGGELKSDGELVLGIILSKYIPKIIALFLLKNLTKFI